jgi:peptidoglycan glycosyltransferase
MELGLLVLAAGIALLGMALAVLGMGEQWAHAIRILAVAGAVAATALILDLAGARRDRILLPVAALLISLGVILISRIDGYLATKQIVWVLIGCAGLIGTYFLVDPVTRLGNWKYLAGVGALALMAVTVIFAPEKNGARLWLSFGHRFSFEPSELAKLLMVVFLAGYVAERGHLLRQVQRRPGATQLQWRYLAPLLVMVLLCLGLFVGQRDVGAGALFLGIFLVMLYLATGRTLHVVGSVVVFGLGIIVAYHVFPYLGHRFVAWLYPWANIHGVGYQPAQGMFALAEGGVGGAGLGLLPVTGKNLPEASSDMIFAVLGQDLGLLGSVAVLTLYGLFVTAGYRIAWRARDSFNGLLATGLTTMFALQAFLIVAGVLRVIPLTGLPLPFMAYGGTSMLVNCIGLGLLLAVSRE